MMLPIDYLDEPSKELTLAFRAIKDRFAANNSDGAAFTVHGGLPNKAVLEGSDRAAWIAITRIEPDPDQAFNTDYYVSRWQINLLQSDPSNDDAGFDQGLQLIIAGDAMKRFRQGIADLGLDGAIDYSEIPTITFNNGTFDSGKTIGLVKIELVLHHKGNVRCE